MNGKTHTFQSLTRDSYRARSKVIKACNAIDQVGVHSKAFRQRLKDFKGEYVCTLAIDDGLSESVLVIDKNFRVAVEPKRVFTGDGDDRKETDESVAARTEYAFARTNVGWHPSLTDGFVIGAVHAAYALQNIVAPAGLIPVLAGAGAGKTPLTHALAGDGDRPYGFVPYGEPLSGYAVNFASIAGALCGALATHDAVVLDSLKDLLTVAPGGAMKSGLSRGVFPIFTQLAVLAADAGSSLYVPINPSTDDDEVVRILAEAISSNATGIIANDPASPTVWKYIFRQGEGLARKTGSITAGQDDEGFMTVNVDGNDRPAHGKSPQHSTFVGGAVSSLGWESVEAMVRAAWRGKAKN